MKKKTFLQLAAMIGVVLVIVGGAWWLANRDSLPNRVFEDIIDTANSNYGENPVVINMMNFIKSGKVKVLDAPNLDMLLAKEMKDTFYVAMYPAIYKEWFKGYHRNVWVMEFKNINDDINSILLLQYLYIHGCMIADGQAVNIAEVQSIEFIHTLLYDKYKDCFNNEVSRCTQLYLNNRWITPDDVVISCELDDITKMYFRTNIVFKVLDSVGVSPLVEKITALKTH